MAFSSMQGPFMIHEGVNVSATSYMIKYSDASTGELCGSTSNSCVGGVCSEEFKIASSLCRPSADINVTVSAVTNLGEGPPTNPILEGEYKNIF